MRSGLLACGLLLVTALLAVACGPRMAEVRGVIVEVQSREIVHADAITLRDQNGALHTFRVSPEVAMNPEHPTTASHLRQHMATADPVIVRYRETAEGPTAIQVVDANPGR